MKIITCEQLSQEWFEARRGLLTASEMDRVITAKTGKPAAAMDDLICELLAAKFTGQQRESVQSKAMANGSATEPEARAWYALDADADVQQVGLCVTDDGRFGCSPDGLVGVDGLIELKCPTGKIHVRYLLDGCLPSEYKPQVHGALIVTGRKWCDFVSYCQGLPPFKIRVVPDDYTDALRSCLAKFWDNYQVALERLNALM